MTEDSILRKIQKCMDLAKNSAAQGDEAGNALRQAQGLMRKHNISDAEVLALGFAEKKISLPIQTNKKHPFYVSTLNKLIRKAFGVMTVMEKEMRVSDLSYAVRIFGPKTRVELAHYAYDVMFREMNRAWTKHQEHNPHLRGIHGARSGFLIGWIEAVDKTIMDFGMNKEEKEGTEAFQLTYYGYELDGVKANGIKILSSTRKSGTNAGSDFRLHRPMDGKENVKIGH